MSPVFIWQTEPTWFRPSVKNVGVEEFDKLRADKKNVVLDVRTPEEFAKGHIPGAVNLNVNAPDFQSIIITYQKKFG